MILDDIFADKEDFKFSPQVVPKQQPNNRPSDVMPISIAVVCTMQNQPSARLLKVFLMMAGRT
jgi:hypothetical protein